MTATIGPRFAPVDERIPGTHKVADVMHCGHPSSEARVDPKGVTVCWACSRPVRRTWTETQRALAGAAFRRLADLAVEAAVQAEAGRWVAVGDTFGRIVHLLHSADVVVGVATGPLSVACPCGAAVGVACAGETHPFRRAFAARQGGGK